MTDMNPAATGGTNTANATRKVIDAVSTGGEFLTIVLLTDQGDLEFPAFRLSGCTTFVEEDRIDLGTCQIDGPHDSDMHGLRPGEMGTGERYITLRYMEAHATERFNRRPPLLLVPRLPEITHFLGELGYQERGGNFAVLQDPGDIVVEDRRHGYKILSARAAFEAEVEELFAQRAAAARPVGQPVIAGGAEPA